MEKNDLSDLAAKIHAANAHLIEQGSIERIDDYFSTEYFVHLGSSSRKGHAAVRGFAKALHKSFSQLRVEVEILMEADDRISWQRTSHGTQTGAFQGFPASGIEITWRDMVVSRFEDGRITQEWVVTDMAEALLRSRKH